tara:strand:- start:377 stop:619 length:243 start_codon:yes stop_codon:yes gene_type:complete
MIEKIMNITGADRQTASMLAIRFCISETTMSFKETSEYVGIGRDPLYTLSTRGKKRMGYSKAFRDMYKKVKSEIITPKNK